MRAEILSIGSELVSGQSLDTNSRWLSQQLGSMGIPVAFHTTLGDELEDHLSAFRTAFDRADLVIMTGGLGPDAGRPDPRGPGAMRRRAAGRGPRFAGGDRGDVRAPEPPDGRAEPRPGAVPPRRRAAAEPDRHGAGHLDDDRPRHDRRLAGGPLRDEADVPGRGRAPAPAAWATPAGSSSTARSTSSARGSRTSRPRRWT